MALFLDWFSSLVAPRKILLFLEFAHVSDLTEETSSDVYWPKYDPESEVLVQAKEAPKPEGRLGQLATSLSGLAGQSAETAAPAASKYFKSDRTAPGPVKKEEAQWSSQLEKSLEQEDSSSENSVNRLREYLSKEEARFQQCYERALLLDRSMSGKVEFMLEFGAQGRISDAQVLYQGEGQDGSRNFLSTCLVTASKKLVLPKDVRGLDGKKVKFYVLLSSW